MRSTSGATPASTMVYDIYIWCYTCQYTILQGNTSTSGATPATTMINDIHVWCYTLNYRGSSYPTLVLHLPLPWFMRSPFGALPAITIFMRSMSSTTNATAMVHEIHLLCYNFHCLCVSDLHLVPHLQLSLFNRSISLVLHMILPR